MRSGGRAAWGSVVRRGSPPSRPCPLAIYLTRFSDSYDLLHAGVRRSRSLPAFGLIAILALARTRAAPLIRLTRGAWRSWSRVAGRILGIVGLCMAASALVALGVYGLLEYVGSRD